MTTKQSHGTGIDCGVCGHSRLKHHFGLCLECYDENAVGNTDGAEHAYDAKARPVTP